MQIHLKAEEVRSLIEQDCLKNCCPGLSRLTLKVTGGVATSQIGSRTDIVLMMLVLQAAESENYRSPRLISSFQKKIKPGSV